ncbi:MAG: C-GCAxxG-C-C family protein [Chloroflexota bacterium]|nr:C-GCAxxG-C-C family protein [Chloroflexota bacterium]
MNKAEQALSSFKEGFSCSQAVFAAYAVEMGVDRETALKISQAFGGGMGNMGETCGAVTGAFIVIGLKYGRTRVDDVEAKRKTYELVRDFVGKFKQRNGTILCRELLGCDIGTPRGRRYIEEKGLTATICPNFVRDAAEILEEIL